MQDGLHQRLATRRELLGKSRLVLHGEDTSPQEKHSAEHFIAGAEREIERMEEECAKGEEAAKQIDALLTVMQKLTMTRHAMLAITALENAGSRLRAHLGADPRIAAELEETKAELARVNAAWEADRRIFAGALLLLNEDENPPGSSELIAAARRAEEKAGREPAIFADPSDADLFEVFTACQLCRPHLLIEIGYSRIADWMVTVWDATNVGIQNAEKLFSYQSPDRSEVTAQAAAQLRERFLKEG